MRTRRGQRRLGLPIAASLLLHLVFGAGIWASTSRAATMPEMRIFAVDIVSPPPTVEGEPTPPSVAEPEEADAQLPEAEAEVVPPTPEPAPPQPDRTPTPPREQTPAPPPTRAEPAPAAPTPAPRPTPARGSNAVASSAGGEGLNVRTEGAEFVDVAYLENVVRTVRRYWRAPPGSRTEEVEVRFWIHRDGSVSNIEIVRASGAFAFRSSAMEAVEQAGIQRAFGPLPAAYGADRLAVSFYFRPAQ
jgi:periplasmic protein TonB